MPRTEERLLKCEIRDGMFSDERVASITRADGRPFSLFVPKSIVVAGEVGEERIRVQVWPRVNEGVTTMIASIPSADPRSVAFAVRNEDLEELTR